MSDTQAAESGEPSDLPPGSAPRFGDGEPFVNHLPSSVVLSATAMRHEAAASDRYPAGQFALAEIPATGFVTIFASNTPGFVHIDADIAYEMGGVLHYEADVRETWVARATSSADDSPATLVRALAAVAGLPRQSTVKVHFQS